MRTCDIESLFSLRRVEGFPQPIGDTFRPCWPLPGWTSSGTCVTTSIQTEFSLFKWGRNVLGGAEKKSKDSLSLLPCLVLCKFPING